MAVELPRRLLPSFLDRLADPECMGTAGASGYSEKEMMDAVRIDLENLLNTRRTVLDVPDDLVEVENSSITYGLPDLTNYNGTSQDQCAELAKVILTAITRFEPRLKNVKVHVARSSEHKSRSVKFHIDASLNVNPAPKVGFETVLELMTGRAVVQPDEGRA